PFQEDLQRAALRLHYLAGDRAGAIRRYEELRRLLDEEMGVPPMAETRALYDAIITDTLPLPVPPRPAEAVRLPLDALQTVVTPSLPPGTAVAAPGEVASGEHVNGAAEGEMAEAAFGGAPPFVGRDAELALLHQRRGRGQLLLVEGEAGIGKTRLIQTFLAQSAAGAPPPLTLVGRARELESRLPYQPLIEALRGLLASPDWPALQPQLQLPAIWWLEAARLAPELAHYQPAAAPPVRSADESRLWEGTWQLFAAIARIRPVMLFLDDLHWADGATLGLLGYLVRQSGAAGLPLTVLAASRPVAPRSELNSLVHSLLREERLARLTLDRLNADEVITLARRISPTYGYPLGSWLFRSSEGNPFVLAELLRYARAHGILTPDGQVNLSLLPTGPVVPPSVYALIQARLAGLSDAARRVLDAAVAVGREFDFEVVARAAALSDSAALDALDELHRARLIQPLEHLRFTFDHSLTVEVAYQEVGEVRHRLLHRRVAAALESIYHDRLDEVAGLLVQHYIEGEQPEQAAKYAWQAGQRAVGLAAWKEAADFFEQALAGASPGQRPRVLAALGNAQLQGGKLAQATETLRAALALPELANTPATLREVVQGLGEALLLQGRYPEAVELARSLAGHPLAAVRVGAEFLWGAALSMEGEDMAGAAAHLRTAEAHLRAHPGDAPPALLAQVIFELGNQDAQQGRLTDAVARYQEALALTAALDSDEALRVHVLAHNNLAYHLHLLGDPAAAGYAQRGSELARDKGLLALLPYLLSTRGELALAEGDLASAERYFQQGLAHAQRLSHPERIAGLTANLGLVAQRRGQTELAVHRFTTALAQADAISNRFLAAQIRLWLAPLLPPDEGRAHLAAARTVITSSGYRRLEAELARLEEAVGSRP
ncbi:MAG TPA: AAA family ATPase, partial [Caldilineaceae bacterium]|nr:AAA family ATPase [Caldilineaceae bacterium]